MILTLTLIILLSVILLFLATKINKLTKIPMLLAFIILGLLMQYAGIGKLPKLVEGINIYTQMISITFIYIMAGQAFNLKSQDKITTELGVLPITLTIIINLILILLIQTFILPTVDVPVWLWVSVLGIATTGTPVLFLIHYNSLPAETRNNQGILRILNGTIFDQVPGMMYVLFPITIGIGMLNANGTLSNSIMQLVIQTIVLLGGIFIGFIVGKVALIGLKKINNPTITVFILVALSAATVNLIPILAGQYLLVAVGTGLSINLDKTEHTDKVKLEASKLSNIFAFPIMFASLGISITLRQILSIRMFIAAFIIYIVITMTKALITKIILRREKFPDEQIRVALAFTLLTGAAYINMAISFKPYFVQLGYNTLDQTLSIIGIILYIFSIVMLPIYGKKENNIIDKIFRLSSK